MYRQKGVITLIMSIILLSAISIFSFMSIQYASSEQQSYTNRFHEAQVAMAAQGGLTYANRYLEKNRGSIIVDSDKNGYIDENAVEFTYESGTKFIIVYTNPIANDFNIINVAVTGVPLDGTFMKPVGAINKLSPYMLYVPEVTLSASGQINLNSGATIVNNATSLNLWTGSKVIIDSTSGTMVNGSTASNSKMTGADIISSDKHLAVISKSDFFKNFFGKTQAEIKGQADTVVTETAPSSHVNGLKDQLIWVESPTAGGTSLYGNIVIGSAAEPVILIVNEPMKMQDVTIYGVLFVGGQWATGNSVTINGAVMSYGGVELNGSTVINYFPDIIDKVKGDGKYGLTSTSWNDLGY